MDLVPGDVVELARGDRVPADLVLLVSSEPLSICYLDTSTLDGESNLKLRQGVRALIPCCGGPIWFI